MIYFIAVISKFIFTVIVYKKLTKKVKQMEVD